MNEQRIPGVKDAMLPSITARAYGVLTTLTVMGWTAAILVVVHLTR